MSLFITFWFLATLGFKGCEHSWKIKALLWKIGAPTELETMVLAGEALPADMDAGKKLTSLSDDMLLLTTSTPTTDDRLGGFFKTVGQEGRKKG